MANTDQLHAQTDLPKPGALFVGSLEKGFRVLAAFGDDHPSLGITEIAERSGLDKSAAQRFSNTLHKLGFLEKDPKTRRYRPSRHLMKLAYTYLRHSNLGAVAMPRLIEAGNVYQTTVNLAERDGLHMTYTIRIPHQTASYVATVPGRSVPIHCTASGIAVLSRLPSDEVDAILEHSQFTTFTADTMTDPAKIRTVISRARKKGFAITYEQLLPREISVAAPIMDAAGHPIAAVHIPAYRPQWTVAEARDKLGPLAVKTADIISNALVDSGMAELS